MTPEYAAKIVGWRYPAPYDFYDMTDANLAFMASPASGYFAVIEGAELVGFRSFGPDGQVPGGGYDSSALDTGGGLRPDLSGKGLSRAAILTGLEFGRREFSPAAFRMTIAAFNVRARRVVTSLGFSVEASFLASADGTRYDILVRPEPARYA